MEFTHKPVLLAECIEALHIRPEGIYVDGTVGRAGHSREIAQRLTTGRLVCIDRDQAAIDAAQERLAPWMDRVTLVHSNFDRRSWTFPAWTVCYLIWEYPLLSWMTRPVDFPICMTHRWTCGWTPPRPLPLMM